MNRLATIGLMSALLAACGPTAGPDLRATITRAQLDTVTDPLMLAEVEGLQTQATLIEWGVNGDVVTWRTGDLVSLSFDRGVLTATRGLGADLMSAETAATRAALAGGPRDNYERFATYLDGEGRTVIRAMVCSLQGPEPQRIVNIGLAVDTARYDERCRSTTDDVTNTYWIGDGGIMWRSRQWVGPGTGYLATERLVR